MNVLNIYDIPDDLYKRLQQLADIENRSLSAQVVIMLTHAVDAHERRMRQSDLLKSIQQRRFQPSQGTPSSLDLLREDRGR